MNKPFPLYLGDVYTFDWPDEQVKVSFDRLHEGRDGDLSAEAEITSRRTGGTQLLHHAKLNLISTRSRTDIVKALLLRIPDIDWGGIMEMACHEAIKHWREGDPVIDLREVPPMAGSRFLLNPYVEYGGPTILFADGGSGKSLFALACGLSIASGRNILGETPASAQPVLYLDWESDPETHADRRRALCVGAGLDDMDGAIFYRRQTSSLAESASHIRREIASRGIGFAVIDSLGAARGGEPESADSTIRLFNAARTLGVPWMGVDHVTKNGGDMQAKPFGSVFTHNLARLTWSLEKVEEGGDGTMTISLSNRKANNGALLGRRAYSVLINQDADGRPEFAQYERANAAEIPALFSRMSQPQQIAAVLRRSNRALSIADIQRGLEGEGVRIPDNQLRQVMGRAKNLFVSIGDGQNTRWGLLTDRTG